MHPPSIAWGTCFSGDKRGGWGTEGLLRDTQVSGEGRETEGLSRQSRNDVTAAELAITGGEWRRKGHPRVVFV